MRATMIDIPERKARIGTYGPIGIGILTYILAPLVLLSCVGGTDNGESMDKFVPTQIQGWTLDGHPTIYDRQTIFDYINGAGEVYLAYGFRKVTVC